MFNPQKYRFFAFQLLIVSLSFSFIVACSNSTPTPSNQKPVVQNVNLTTISGQEVSVVLEATDSDDDVLSFDIQQPEQGNAVLNDDNSVTYKSNVDFVGNDSFQYRAFDGKDYSDFASIQITVNTAVQNKLPVVKAIEVSTQINTAVTVQLLGSDADGDSIVYEVVLQPGKGTLGAISTDKVVYTPNNGFTGQDSFKYAARDAEGLSVSAEVKIQVIQNNTAPRINNQSFSVQENKGVNTVVGKVIASDPEGDTLSYEIVGGNARNTFSIVSTTGEVRLSQRPNFELQASYPLQVKVSDADGLSKTATVTIQIVNVNYGKIIFAGDSITRGWDGVSGSRVGGWPLKVQNALNTSFASDFTIQNSGVDGDTAIGLKARLPNLVSSQNPSYVTVQIGTNDVYNNSGIAQASPTVAGYEAQIAAILQNLKTTPSIKQVFVLGIISPIKSRTDVRFPGLIQIPQGQLDSQVAAYNAALLRQSQQRGFVFINLAAQFPADAAGRLAWLPDGVHPSEAGYNRIASIVEAQLRANFQ